jgi:hypothetical protein
MIPWRASQEKELARPESLGAQAKKKNSPGQNPLARKPRKRTRPAGIPCRPGENRA